MFLCFLSSHDLRSKICLCNLSPSWAVCIHFGKQTTLWVRFSFLSFFFFFFFKGKRLSGAESNHLPQSLGHHCHRSMLVSSHCICLFHFNVYFYPATLASHRWTFHGVVVYPFICICSHKTSIIDLCAVLIYINYLVLQISFSSFILSTLFLKFYPSCVFMYLHFIALYTSAVFCLSLPPVMGIWITSSSTGLAEIERLGVTKW